jgi:hypothetical protein
MKLVFPCIPKQIEDRDEREKEQKPSVIHRIVSRARRTYLQARDRARRDRAGGNAGALRL